MQTINDVVNAVLANPDAYTDAFPVAESAPTGQCLGDTSRVQREMEGGYWPPATAEFMREMLERYSPILQGMDTQPFPDMNGPTADLSGAMLTREQFDEARNYITSRAQGHVTTGNNLQCSCGYVASSRTFLTNHLTSASRAISGAQLTPEVLEGTRIALRQNVLHQDSVVSRLMHGRDFQNYQWPGLHNGEPVTNGHCYRCNRDRLCVSRRVDSLEQGATAYAHICMECLSGGHNSHSQPPRGYRQPVYRDWGTQWVMDNTLPPNGPVAFDLEAPQRPDHYRVRSGECACGFNAPFTDDTHQHLNDDMPPERNAGLHTRISPGQCACGYRSMFTGDMDRHIAGGN